MTDHAWEEEWAGVPFTYEDPDQPFVALCERKKAEFLREIAGEVKGRATLEVGCGGAVCSVHLARAGACATVVDREETALALAHRNFERGNATADYVQADAERLPFPDGTFDLVMSHGLLEHFEDPAPAIHEMARTLHPGGLFFAEIVPRKLSLQSFAHVFNATAKFLVFGFTFRWRRLRASLRHVLPDYHESRFGPDRYRAILEELGIEASACPAEPYPRLSLPPSWNRRYAAWAERRMARWNEFRHAATPTGFARAAAFYLWGRKAAA